MRGLPFDLRFEMGTGVCGWCMVRRARSTSTCSRQAGAHVQRIAAGADCDVLVFGHTHQPWVAE
jgi:hypothetical protein